MATLMLVSGHWVLQSVWCPGASTPVPQQQTPEISLAEIRQRAIRLLPTVAIGSAWHTRGLVNAEAIVWADTDRSRSLSRVQVVGQPVDLRLTFDSATWDFGDGTSTTTDSPGTPYDASTDPCHAAECPGYFGHTYRDPGTRTITLRVAWRAEFSLDGGATWEAVDPAALAGPSSSATLQIVQARGVLVPNP